MPLQATSGAASYDAFGGGVPVVPAYIEEVFSTYLYTGNDSTQTINNGIDLSTKGGLVWAKSRAAGNHFLYDTTRGVNKYLMSNATDSQTTQADSLTAFNTTGFSIGNALFNDNAVNYASWTFRKQPKFFDIVTWSGNDASNRQITHNLGSVPGCIIVKTTGTATDWNVYHRSLGNTKALYLNLTQAQETNTNWGNTTPTSSVFTTNLNGAGNNYIAYLFAHNAGGFGLTGTDNVISCGSFTTDGGGSATVDLGYEPQWLLMRSSSTTDNWYIFDVMRGFSQTSAVVLFPNGTSNDYTFTSGTTYPFTPTATGFYTNQTLNGSQDYIYIAIRRGPMKVPTSGTSVFSPQIATSSGSASNTVTTNFPVDLAITQVRNGYFAELLDRLRGDSQSTYVRLRSASTAAEATGAFGLGFDNNTGYVDNYNWQNFGGGPFVYWNFKRAPSFFDEVCYTGTGSATTFTHNLGVVPELMIVKTRTESGRGWAVYAAPLGATKWLRLELTNAEATASTLWNNTAPTSSVFTVGTSAWTNNNTQSFVNYLFATCAGVSKVFSYTGNGSSQTINCGFTGGARFVLIKRTDSTGDWYVWDSARGIVSGNDPHLSLNTTAAEVTSNDTIDTDSTGFVVNQVSATDVNVSSATYIGLAIA